MDQLKKAFNSGNEESALRMINNINGVSGNIGASELHIASKELERKFKKKDYKNLDEILDEYNLSLKAQFLQALQNIKIHWQIQLK